MSNQKKKRRKKITTAHDIAGGAVGMVINVVLVVVAAMFIYRFSMSAYQYGIRIFGEPPMSEAPGEEVIITVTDGMDFDGIAEMLYENGLVRDVTLFKIQERVSNYAEDGFKEGTYTLSTAMTPDEMMDVMAGSGET